MPKPLTNVAACVASRWLLLLLLVGAGSVSLGATEDVPVHGLWVWSGPSILRTPGLPVEADIGKKLLEGKPAEREMLLSSLPRFTLMLYELSSPDDGRSVAEKSDTVEQVSGKLLEMAYSGLRAPHLATIVIGLRTPDYGPLLSAMLNVLDATNHANPHYAGWVRHSYNDTLRPD